MARGTPICLRHSCGTPPPRQLGNCPPPLHRSRRVRRIDRNRLVNVRCNLMNKFNEGDDHCSVYLIDRVPLVEEKEEKDDLPGKMETEEEFVEVPNDEHFTLGEQNLLTIGQLKEAVSKVNIDA